MGWYGQVTAAKEHDLRKHDWLVAASRSQIADLIPESWDTSPRIHTEARSISMSCKKGTTCFYCKFFLQFFGDLAGNSKSKTSEHLERTLQPPDFYCNSGMEIAQNVLVTWPCCFTDEDPTFRGTWSVSHRVHLDRFSGREACTTQAQTAWWPHAFSVKKSGCHSWDAASRKSMLRFRGFQFNLLY